MTEENKKTNIREELQRAETALAAADILYENKYVNDAVSRLYYYLFHGIKALLFSGGIEPKSHEGALQMFSLHYVKTEKFEPVDSHMFARLMKYRAEADYSASYVFTGDDFITFRRDSEKVYQNILAYLKNEKYI